MLRGEGRRKRDLALSRERFYEDIQALISALPPDERATLKELTDWVEAYAVAEAAQPATGEAAGQKKRRP